MGAFSLRMPRRFLRGAKARFVLTVLALAIGVALVSAVDLANRAVERAFVAVIDAMAGRAALSVSAGGDGTLPELRQRYKQAQHKKYCPGEPLPPELEDKPCQQ